MDLKDRVRKVDVDSLPMEQVESLSNQIGEKVRGICDEAAAKVNAILNIYGMSAKIAIKFDKMPSAMKKKTKTPRKSSKRVTQDNL